MADRATPVCSENIADEKTPLVRSVGTKNGSPGEVDVSALNAARRSNNISNWKRWISIYVMYFTMFLGAMNFSIVLSSLFPYLRELSHGTASTAFFGWVVAAFSMGQLVASPFFGLWFDHRPPQEPVIVSLIIGLVANLVYSYAEAFPGDSPRYVLIAARVVVGISAGSGAVARSYVTSATTKQERTGALAGVSASQAVGFILGPVLGMAFVPLGDRGLYVSQLRFYLNMYTGPGYLGALLIVLNLILVLALFRDSRLPMQAPLKRGSSILGRIGLNTEKDVAESERSIQGEEVVKTRQGYDRIAAFTCIYIFFIVFFVFAVFETIGTPYTMDEFSWSSAHAVLYNNIFYGVLAVLGVICFVGIKYITKIFDERLILVIALILIAVGMFAIIPMGDGIAKIHMMNSTGVNESSSATAAPLDDGGCRYPELKWCLTEPHLLLVQYLLGLFSIGVGYPLATVLCFSIYSKILGPFPPGKMMGILTAAGSLSRVVGPMFVTFIYDKLGPQIAFATIDGIIVTAIILLMILYYRLVPYGQHWGF